jgi:hypothetical protein
MPVNVAKPAGRDNVMVRRNSSLAVGCIRYCKVQSEMSVGLPLHSLGQVQTLTVGRMGPVVYQIRYPEGRSSWALAVFNVGAL